jgi:hypothetical protein
VVDVRDDGDVSNGAICHRTQGLTRRERAQAGITGRAGYQRLELEPMAQLPLFWRIAGEVMVGANHLAI